MITIIYLVVGHSNTSTLLSRYNFRQNILLSEQSSVTGRIFISGLKENLKDVSFIARCVEVGDNQPIEHNGRKLDRRLLTCGDETQETFHVTTWEETARNCSTILPGNNINVSRT